MILSSSVNEKKGKGKSWGIGRRGSKLTENWTRCLTDGGMSKSSTDRTPAVLHKMLRQRYWLVWIPRIQG